VGGWLLSIVPERRPRAAFQTTGKTAQNTCRGPFERAYGKFSTNSPSFLVNFKVPLALRMANFKVFVSKNRNLPCEHLRGARSRSSEHFGHVNAPEKRTFDLIP
jgi:hypothetical protein